MYTQSLVGLDRLHTQACISSAESRPASPLRLVQHQNSLLSRFFGQLHKYNPHAKIKQQQQKSKTKKFELHFLPEVYLTFFKLL